MNFLVKGEDCLLVPIAKSEGCSGDIGIFNNYHECKFSKCLGFPNCVHKLLDVRLTSGRFLKGPSVSRWNYHNADVDLTANCCMPLKEDNATRDVADGGCQCKTDTASSVTGIRHTPCGSARPVISMMPA